MDYKIWGANWNWNPISANVVLTVSVLSSDFKKPS